MVSPFSKDMLSKVIRKAVAGKTDVVVAEA